MAIQVSCSCGKQFQTADEHAGRHVQCPSCGVTVKVPRQTSATNSLAAGTSSAARRYQCTLCGESFQVTGVVNAGGQIICKGCWARPPRQRLSGKDKMLIASTVAFGMGIIGALVWISFAMWSSAKPTQRGTTLVESPSLETPPSLPVGKTDKTSNTASTRLTEASGHSSVPNMESGSAIAGKSASVAPSSPVRPSAPALPPRQFSATEKTKGTTTSEPEPDGSDDTNGPDVALRVGQVFVASLGKSGRRLAECLAIKLEVTAHSDRRVELDSSNVVLQIGSTRTTEYFLTAPEGTGLTTDTAGTIEFASLDHKQVYGLGSTKASLSLTRGRPAEITLAFPDAPLHRSRAKLFFGDAGHVEFESDPRSETKPTAGQPSKAVQLPPDFAFLPLARATGEVDLTEFMSRHRPSTSTLTPDGLFLRCGKDAVQGLKGKGLTARHESKTVGGSLRSFWKPEPFACYRDEKLIGIWEPAVARFRSAKPGEANLTIITEEAGGLRGNESPATATQGLRVLSYFTATKVKQGLGGNFFRDDHLRPSQPGHVILGVAIEVEKNALVPSEAVWRALKTEEPRDRVQLLEPDRFELVLRGRERVRGSLTAAWDEESRAVRAGFAMGVISVISPPSHKEPTRTIVVGWSIPENQAAGPFEIAFAGKTVRVSPRHKVPLREIQ